MVVELILTGEDLSVISLCNVTISWKMTLQSIAPLSITKLEYIAAIEGV